MRPSDSLMNARLRTRSLRTKLLVIPLITQRLSLRARAKLYASIPYPAATFGVILRRFVELRTNSISKWSIVIRWLWMIFTMNLGFQVPNSVIRLAGALKMEPWTLTTVHNWLRTENLVWFSNIETCLPLISNPRKNYTSYNENMFLKGSIINHGNKSSFRGYQKQQIFNH